MMLIRLLFSICAIVLIAACAASHDAAVESELTSANNAPNAIALSTTIEPTMTATNEPLTTPDATVSAALPRKNDKLLFKFTSRETAGRWYIVNDSVMGGVSQSAASVVESGVLQFSGTVSLENNGGFASLRSEPATFEIANAEAIRLRVLGDGQAYRLRIRTDARLDGVAYDQPFETIAGAWQEVVLPIADFNPQFRGRILSNQPPLDAASITSIGIMITDKQEGGFSLLVDWISAVFGDSAEQIQSDDA